MRKILYVDMDNVLTDFGEAMARQPREVLEAYAGKPDEIPGIFADMVPMPHAIESFLKLSQLFDTYILSTAPWGNDTAWSDKHRWVKQHLGVAGHKRLILTHHKNLNRGDFLVDDRTKHRRGPIRRRTHPLRDGTVPGLEGGGGVSGTTGLGGRAARALASRISDRARAENFDSFPEDGLARLPGN